MAGDIGKGDWVECIDVSTNKAGSTPMWIQVGRLYQVDEPHIGLHGASKGIPMVSLVGQPKSMRANQTGYHASRFRPVYRPKAEMFRVETPPPQRVKEPA